MKVILKEDVRGVGKQGDIKVVSPGYARNFLLPRKLAVPATPQSLQELETAKKRETTKQGKAHAALKKIADDIAGKTITMKARAEGEALFGSVDAATIAKHVQEQLHVSLNPSALALEHPIKKLGTHSVKARFGRDAEATFHLIIEKA